MNQSALPAAPYKGLIPYAEEDAPFFFGRDPDKEIITANLIARRLTLLYGPSGVGKSSVLRAGVEHQLLEQARQNLAKRGTPEFAVVVFNQWRDDPRVYLELEVLKSVASAFNGQPPDSGQMPSDFVEMLRINTERVGGRLLIILDQFEEYFLYHAQEDGPGTFAAEFPRVINDPDLPISFLISIREDALAKLDKFEGRIPRLFDNYLRVEHLDREAAREAIERPIEKYNQLHAAKDQPIGIEPALVDAVLDQVKTGQVVIGEAGRGVIGGEEDEAQIETPFLQLVMTRLWQEETGAGSRVLRLETLDRLGGAEQIVKTHLDEVMSGLSAEEQAVAAKIFPYLVTRSRTKIAYPVFDLAGGESGIEERPLTAVLKKLSGEERIAGEQARILRPIAPPIDRPGEMRYEIFHDVLAPAILSWRAKYVEEQKRVETERQLELEARERERAERQLAREQKLVRRQRWLLAVMAILLAAMIGVTTYAFGQRAKATRAQADAEKQKVEAVAQKNRAEEALTVAATERDKAKSAFEGEAKQRKEADSQRDAADRAKAEANRQRLAAVKAKATAEEQRTIAQSRELAASAIAESQFNPELGVLLATEAVKVKHTPQAEEAFRQAMIALPSRAVLRGHTGYVHSAAFSPDGKLIVTASRDGTARVWDASTGQSLRELRRHTNVVRSAAFSFDGKLIVTASNDGTTRVWDASTGQSLRELGHTDAVSSAAFSPNGKLIVTTSNDRTARVWDAGTGQSLRELHGHTGAVLSAAFSPDGKLIVTVSSDGTARVWDAGTGQSLRELRGHTGAVLSAAFSPDGKLIVTASHDRTARVWDAGTGQSLKELRGHTSAVLSAAFSPDGKLIVTVSSDGTARVWDAGAGQSLKELRGHTGFVSSAAFSPGGKLIVTASYDGTARVWDAGTGQSLRELRGHTDAVWSAAFSPDGKLIVTASGDGTARVWDAGTGQSLKELRGHTDPVLSAAFSPDGKLIVTASSDQKGIIYPWEAFAPFDDLQRAARIRVVRELTPKEREKYLPEPQKK